RRSLADGLDLQAVRPGGEAGLDLEVPVIGAVVVLRHQVVPGVVHARPHVGGAERGELHEAVAPDRKGHGARRGDVAVETGDELLGPHAELVGDAVVGPRAHDVQPVAAHLELPLPAAPGRYRGDTGRRAVAVETHEVALHLGRQLDTRVDRCGYGHEPRVGHAG